MLYELFVFFFFKQKTAYEMRISDWSSDVCSSDLWTQVLGRAQQLMLEQAAGATGRTLPFDPEAVARIQTGFADEGLALLPRFLDYGGPLRDPHETTPSSTPAAARPPRFAAPTRTRPPLYQLTRTREPLQLGEHRDDADGGSSGTKE